MDGIVVIAVGLWGVIVTIFWMIVGWRAMVAHEQIARSIARVAPGPLRIGEPESRQAGGAGARG